MKSVIFVISCFVWVQIFSSGWEKDSVAEISIRYGNGCVKLPNGSMAVVGLEAALEGALHAKD